MFVRCSVILVKHLIVSHDLLPQQFTKLKIYVYKNRNGNMNMRMKNLREGRGIWGDPRSKQHHPKQWKGRQHVWWQKNKPLITSHTVKKLLLKVRMENEKAPSVKSGKPNSGAYNLAKWQPSSTDLMNKPEIWTDSTPFLFPRSWTLWF